MTEEIVSLLSLRKTNKFYIFSIVPFILTAFFSIGFLHPDEHYQILELVNLKLGSVQNPSIFNWDYHEKIRSWFQPALYSLILYPFHFFTSPFMQALIIRLFNGLLGWYSLKRLIENNFKKEKHSKYLFYFSLVWFVPYLFVRTSSESLSVSLFLIGSTLFLNKNFLSGLIFGLSFLARYQMGIVLFCVNIYQLIKDRDIKRFMIHSSGIAAAILLGVLIDFWGYGEWCISTFNYLNENIFKSRASSFGVDPFWYYLVKPLIKGVPPITIILAISTVIYGIRKRFDFWTVSFVSFLIIHSLVPHKEVRFLTFNYILAVFFTLMALNWKKLTSNKFYKNILKFTVAVNLLVLAKVVFSPAKSTVKLYKFMYENNISSISTLINESNKHFKFTMPFYQKSLIKVKPILIESIQDEFLLTTKFNEYNSVKELSKCKPIYSQYSEWIKHLNFFNWLKRSSYNVVWKCSLN